VTSIPLRATPFADFIDGYFPLSMAFRHLLERNRFASALVFLRVAPMMDIPGLAPDAPVPLYLDPAHGGLITWLGATVAQNGRISGLARWRWNDPARAQSGMLSPHIRLAEPAFLRGVGFVSGDIETRALGCIAQGAASSAVFLTASTEQVLDLGLVDSVSWPIDGSSEGLHWLSDDIETGRAPSAPKNILLHAERDARLGSVLSDARAGSTRA